MLRNISRAAQGSTNRIGLSSKPSQKKPCSLLTPSHTLQIILKSFAFKNAGVRVEAWVHLTYSMMPGYGIILSQMNTFENFSNFKRSELSPPCPNLSDIHLFFPFLPCYCICLQNVVQGHTGDRWAEKVAGVWEKSTEAEWAQCWPNWWVCGISASSHPVLIILPKFLLDTWPHVLLRQLLQLLKWGRLAKWSAEIDSLLWIRV